VDILPGSWFHTADIHHGVPPLRYSQLRRSGNVIFLSLLVQVFLNLISKLFEIKTVFQFTIDKYGKNEEKYLNKQHNIYIYMQLSFNYVICNNNSIQL
jgi:hypothetical protein